MIFKGRRFWEECTETEVEFVRRIVPNGKWKLCYCNITRYYYYGISGRRLLFPSRNVRASHWRPKKEWRWWSANEWTKSSWTNRTLHSRQLFRNIATQKFSDAPKMTPHFSSPGKNDFFRNKRKKGENVGQCVDRESNPGPQLGRLRCLYTTGSIFKRLQNRFLVRSLIRVFNRLVNRGRLSRRTSNRLIWYIPWMSGRLSRRPCE